MATQITNRSPLTQALKSCYPALGATFVLSMFINATMLASPLYSMQVYDRVLTSRNVSTLVMLTLIVGVFLVLYGVLEFTRSGVLARAGVQFESFLRRPLFETMMKAELSPQHRLGQQVIRDAETIRECITGGVAAIICDLPWTPIFVVLCFLQHFVLGTVALVGAFLLFGLAVVTEFYTRTGVNEAGRLANEANRFAASALRNGEVVRGLGMGDVVLDRWSGAQSAHITVHSAATERGAALHALVKFVRLSVQIYPALRRRLAGHRPGDFSRRHDGRLDHHGPRAGSDRANRWPVEADRRFPHLLQPSREPVPSTSHRGSADSPAGAERQY